jgi:hypothetical protein
VVYPSGGCGCRRRVGTLVGAEPGSAGDLDKRSRAVVITYVLLAAVFMPIAMALIAAVVYGREHDPPAVAQREDG